MKYLYTITFALLLASSSSAQVFDVDTLQYKGSTSKYINIVIMGDGYTSTEQTQFITDANNLSTYLFSQAPWQNYINYFNVFAIKVVSAQSGTAHPNTASDCGSANPIVPVSNPNTYFNSTFDYAGIHRLVVPTNSSNISAVLAANFPSYDQVLILANTPYYGGSGGAYATSTLQTASPEITAHEIGHSFAGLADEYYAGDGYAAELPNMTQQTNTSLVKWKNWLNYNGTGIYQHCCGGNSALWYKPNQNCKMQFLGSPYCSICTQTIVESIHSLVNPIVSYSPASAAVSSADLNVPFRLTEVMKPVSNTLLTQWKLDGAIVSYADSAKINAGTLPAGTHTLTVTVTDTSSLLRVDGHASLHYSTVTWSINQTTTGVNVVSAANKISYAVYPNPTSDVLNIGMELEQKSKVSIELVSMDGKRVLQIEDKMIDSGKYANAIDLRQVAAGNYSLVFNVDNVIHTELVTRD